MTTIRRATLDDVPVLSSVLTAAFLDDPTMLWVFPDARTRPTQLRAFFRLALRARLRRGDWVLTTTGLEGGAVWAPPGRWRASPGELLANLPGLLWVFRRRPIVPLRFLTTMERHHPNAPHWYLNNLGTDPHRRGRGIASALLGLVLEQCDRDLVSAYLETANPDNVPFYQRRGFVVTGELTMPARGPHFWVMWREPAVSNRVSSSPRPS